MDFNRVLELLRNEKLLSEDDSEVIELRKYKLNVERIKRNYISQIENERKRHERVVDNIRRKIAKEKVQVPADLG